MQTAFIERNHSQRLASSGRKTTRFLWNKVFAPAPKAVHRTIGGSQPSDASLAGVCDQPLTRFAGIDLPPCFM